MNKKAYLDSRRGCCKIHKKYVQMVKNLLSGKGGQIRERLENRSGGYRPLRGVGGTPPIRYLFLRTFLSVKGGGGNPPNPVEKNNLKMSFLGSFRAKVVR